MKLGDIIFYWMFTIVLILFVCIPLAYVIGVSKGYRNGFLYGYDNNPIKSASFKTIDDIKFLLKDIDLDEERQLIALKLIKQLDNLEDDLYRFEKELDTEKMI